MELTERKRQILKVVVEDYVRTAEPVGSKTIAARMGRERQFPPPSATNWRIWWSWGIWNSHTPQPDGYLLPKDTGSMSTS